MKTHIALLLFVVGCEPVTGPDYDVRLWEVDGVVEGSAGAVAEASVALWSYTEAGWFGGSPSEFSVHTTSDDSGRFSFRVQTEECPHSPNLVASHPDYYRPIQERPSLPCPGSVTGIVLRLEPLGTLTITTGELPTAILGVEYSASMTALGSTFNPISWSIVDGSLPPGLSLRYNGEINGVPTSVGSWGFTIEASSPDTRTPDRADFSIDVVPGDS